MVSDVIILSHSINELSLQKDILKTIILSQQQQQETAQPLLQRDTVIISKLTEMSEIYGGRFVPYVL